MDCEQALLDYMANLALEAKRQGKERVRLLTDNECAAFREGFEYGALDRSEQ